MKTNTEMVASNRAFYLKELRSGKYSKGTTRSDARGRPIVESSSDEGWCACALMHDLFFLDNHADYLHSLGLTARQCEYIQKNLNDTPLTFQEIADRIEREVFVKGRIQGRRGAFRGVPNVAVNMCRRAKKDDRPSYLRVQTARL